MKKIDITLFSYLAILFSWLSVMTLYDFKHTQLQDAKYELSLAKKEIKKLTQQLNTPRKDCASLELDLIAQKKLIATLQGNIVHLEKLEYICESEELDFQSLLFKVQELEDDCKCR